MATVTHHYEYKIDEHRTRGEVQLVAGKWQGSAYVDPLTVGEQTDRDTARSKLSKALRDLADDIDRGDDPPQG